MVFAYACYTDIKRYEVDDWVWVVYVVVGFPLGLYLCRNELDIYLISVGLTGAVLTPIAMLSIKERINFGLGDVKGIFSLSLVIPFQSQHNIQLLQYIPFALSSFVNAVIIGAILVVFLRDKNRIPFMVPLTLGIITELFIGDFFFELVSFISGL